MQLVIISHILAVRHANMDAHHAQVVQNAWIAKTALLLIHKQKIVNNATQDASIVNWTLLIHALNATIMMDFIQLKKKEMKLNATNVHLIVKLVQLINQEKLHATNVMMATFYKKTDVINALHLVQPVNHQLQNAHHVLQATYLMELKLAVLYAYQVA